MNPDFLEPIAAGSLVRPGALGRLVRALLGLFCLYALWAIVRHAADTTFNPFTTLNGRLILVLMPLCFFNYVVNIGYAKKWGYRPVIVSLISLGALAVSAFLVSASFDSPILGLPLNLWLAYSYGHLGISFVLAALIATPGCEMRAIPELLGRLTGNASPEHRCPVSFIAELDRWEQRQRSG